MKIINAGNINKLKEVKRFVCSKCGCVFEADKTEYKIGPCYYYVDCPFCKNTVGQEYS